MTDDKTFKLYKDLGSKFSKLSREEKGAILEAIFAFENDEPIPDDMPIGAAIAWDFLLPMLESAEAKYQDTSEKRRNAANERWEKEKARAMQTDANDMQTDANDMQTDANDMQTDANDMQTDAIKNKEERIKSKEKGDTYVSQKKKAVRPTLEEVKEYALEKARPEEAEPFYDFYESNGWKVGKNPMRDWQASFRNWLRSNFDRGKKNKDAGLEELMAAEVAKEKAENDARGVQPFSWDAEDISGVHNTGNLFRVV